MKPIRLAVIGYGRLGKVHARLVQSLPNVQLMGVVEPLAEAIPAVTADLNLPTFAHHQQLAGNIDAAIVATPTTTHFDVAVDLLRQGLHVFVEKPITPTAGQARTLAAEAQARRLVLQVGHVERFNPALRAARPHCQQPCYIEASRTSGYTCRSIDIGVVLDLMIHDLDVILSLVPASVVHIQAVGAAVFGPYEDMAQARLTFANGCVANLTASRVSRVAERNMRIFHREGMAAIDFAQKTASIMRPSEKLQQGIDVQQLDEQQKEQLRTRLFEDLLPTTELHVADSNAILEQQREFVQCIEQGTQPSVNGQAGCRAVEIAEQIAAQIREYQRSLSEPRILAVPELDSAPLPFRQAG